MNYELDQRMRRECIRNRTIGNYCGLTIEDNAFWFRKRVRSVQIWSSQRFYFNVGRNARTLKLDGAIN